MKNIVVFGLFLFCVMPTFGQEKYWVFFKDKPHAAHQMQQPEQFLSERALARRARFNIPITAADVPLHPQHVQALKDAGFEVVHHSKWLNAVSVRCDAAQLEKVAKLPMV
jgi:serine protease AprX